MYTGVVAVILHNNHTFVPYIKDTSNDNIRLYNTSINSVCVFSKPFERQKVIIDAYIGLCHSVQSHILGFCTRNIITYIPSPIIEDFF